jgi:PAS domain S-box-containing protein
LARERDALAAEVQVLKAALRKTATENAPQSGGASAQSAWEAAELRAGEEEWRLPPQEAHVLAENLEAANAAFIQTNLELKRQASELKIELEAARAALRTGEEHLRLIFESATEYAIFTLGLDGRFTSWNPGAQRILGFTEDKILGRPADVIFTPEDREARIPEMEMCRAAEEGRAVNDGWRQRADGSRFWGSGQTMPLVDSDGQMRGFLKILRDQTERHQSEERRALLLRELGHRVKNALATAQAVAAQTLREAGAPADLRATFEARLMALARSHDMLSQSDWEGAPLHEVVERTLEPYAADGEVGRVTVNGRPVRLAPNTTVTLNLALHELATNAAKYGALSLPGGRIEVTWDLEQRLRNATPVVTILWRERGGPPVRPPERRGFGSRLLEHALPHDSGGEVTLNFPPEGVECRIRLPLVARERLA